MLVMDANKMEVVTRFMKDLQAIAEHFHAAVVGSVGAPKSKQGQGYTAKRDNLTGSAAWGRNCETIALLQFPKGEDTSIRRELTVLPRNGRAELFSLVLNDGLLEIEKEGDPGQSAGTEGDPVVQRAGPAGRGRSHEEMVDYPGRRARVEGAAFDCRQVD
jgi:hypothetical protein